MMHSRFHFLVFLFSFLLILPLQTGHARTDAGLSALDLPYGKDRSVVISLVQKQLEKQMYQQIRATNDPVKRATLGQKRSSMAQTLANSYHPTTATKAHYRLSPITGLVAVGLNSGVLQEKTTGNERFLLFHEGRLYGAVLTLPASGSLPELVESLSADLGKPTAFHRKGKNSDMKVLGVEWRRGADTLLLKDFTEDYGVRILARLHTDLWAKARKATEKALDKRGPGDKKPAEDLLEEFLER